jgi:hypothetical protein
MYYLDKNIAFLRASAKIAKSEMQLRHVCLPVRPTVGIEQFGSHCTDFQ